MASKMFCSDSSCLRHMRGSIIGANHLATIIVDLDSTGNVNAHHSVTIVYANWNPYG